MNLQDIISSYDPQQSLDRASTIPSSWYTNKDLYNLELKSVFSNTATRRAHGSGDAAGQYVTTDIGGEPIVVVRGNDGVLRAFSTFAAITQRR